MTIEPAERVHRDPDLTSVLALSARESQVLGETARGLTNEQVAARLQVSVHAVKFHLAAIYRKLGVTNRTEAASVYLRALAAGIGAGGR